MTQFPDEEKIRDAWLDNQCALLALRWVEIHLISLSPEQTPPWTHNAHKELVKSVIQSGGMLDGKTLPGVADWLVEYTEANAAVVKTARIFDRLYDKRLEYQRREVEYEARRGKD